MIERVVHALRALAGMPDAQPGGDPQLVARLDALARDYADALRLLADCPQVDLSPEQQGLLERVEDALDAMTGATRAPTGSAPREADARRTVRELARAALRALAQREDRPPSS